jgi:hypothetical protein
MTTIIGSARARSVSVTVIVGLALGLAVVAALPAPGAAQVLTANKGGPSVPGGLVSEPPAPLSLTASDGAGLELVSLAAQAVVEDPLAFTELHLIFRNPESRVREGRFRITLPAGATISRFAMRVGDRWQEGEVVEQQAARIAYEDFLHRRQDPALLETEAGNEFSARVFPIPPAATKELIVSYSQELTRSDAPYRLPLRGLPTLGSLSIRALVRQTMKTADGGDAPASSLGGQRAQHEVVEVNKRDFRPDRDFEIAHTGAAGRLGLRNGNLVVARVVPLAESDRRDDVGSLLVLIDTSASRALGLSEQIAAFEGLMSALRKDAGNDQGGNNGGNQGCNQGGNNDPLLSVAAFDQEVTPIFTGKASAMGDVVRRRLIERRALGASNLEHALRWAAQTLAPKNERRARLLLITDGVATAGETAAAGLRDRIKALASVGVERLDVLAVGGIRDDALLAQLVTAGLPRDGMVLDAGQPAAPTMATLATLARRLTRATRSGLKLEIDGAGWIWPTVLNGIQPGDEVLVYADLPADKPLRVKVAGQPLALAGALATVQRPLLERSWVKARITRLLDMQDRNDGPGAADSDMKDVFKKQAIELSIKNRVLCPLTSLLVLETEQDYARFGIERRALADILTVGAGGIALLHRTDLAPVPQEIAVGDPRGHDGDEDDDAQEGGSALSPQARPSAKGSQLAKAKSAKAEVAADGRFRESEVRTGNRMSGVIGGVVGGTSGGAVARDRAEPTRNRVASSPDIRAPRMTPAPAPAPAAQRMPEPSVAPLQGPFKEIMTLVQRRDFAAALNQALAWRARDAGDVLALVALGECGEGSGDVRLAARAYGSIIDLFPGRADMRRFAGERLERVHNAAALALAIDTYRKAVEQRPDHPAGHRLLAFALIKQGHPREAFTVLAAAVARPYPAGRFAGVDRVLREDLGLAAAAWTHAEPTRADDIRAQLERAHGVAESAPSVRFVLNWETDANDVDFHIHDGKGGHAFYSAPHLPSGGDLYADVTTGYGPECFTIRGPAQQRAFPYRLQAHYYSRGPMGYGMGKLQVIEHDGRGNLRFDERPFVIMQDGAFVDLGTVAEGTPSYTWLKR